MTNAFHTRGDFTGSVCVRALRNSCGSSDVRRFDGSKAAVGGRCWKLEGRFLLWNLSPGGYSVTQPPEACHETLRNQP